MVDLWNWLSAVSSLWRCYLGVFAGPWRWQCRLGVISMAVLSLGSIAAAVDGRTPDRGIDVDQEARKIFTTVMSPYCPGLLLADCGSKQAEVLRDTIRVQLARGRAPADIVDELVEIYGEEIIGLPSYQGVDSLVWLGPLAVLLIGLVLISRWIRQRSNPRPSPGQGAAAPDLSLQEKFKKELHNREE